MLDAACTSRVITHHFPVRSRDEPPVDHRSVAEVEVSLPTFMNRPRDVRLHERQPELNNGVQARVPVSTRNSEVVHSSTEERHGGVCPQTEPLGTKRQRRFGLQAFVGGRHPPGGYSTSEARQSIIGQGWGSVPEG